MSERQPATGICYGVDVGAARVGVARSVSTFLPPMPVATLTRDAANDADIAELISMLEQESVHTVFVGLPLNLRGAETPSTQAARNWAQLLANRLRASGSSTLVRLVDERLSTVGAAQKLHQAGRSTKKQRAVIDQQAAIEILQHSLDMQESLQRAVGELVDGNE